MGNLASDPGYHDFVIAVPQGQHTLGACEGEIIPEERGSNGFGYDPVFYKPELGRTLAELSESEKNRTRYFPVRHLPFLKNEMVKASDSENEKIPYTCRLAPLFKQMDIPDSFTVSGRGNTVFLQSENYKGNNFRLVFSCDRNSSVIADGIQLESPILCTAAYNTAYSGFHMVLWGREAASCDEVKEHIAQCISRGVRVVDWLDAHVDEIVELPVPSWFDL